jgi:hypothetical protein
MSIDENKIKRMLKASETGGNSNPNQLSFARKGASGWSVGEVQNDLGKHPDIAKDLAKELVKNGKFTESEKEVVTTWLNTRPSETLGKEDQEKKKKIDEYLASDAGKDWVEKQDKAQVKKVAGDANQVVEAAKRNPRYQTDQAFRAEVDSDRFALQSADMMNQFGSQEGLKKWAEGGTGTVGGREVKMGTAVPNFETMVNIELGSTYLKDSDGNENDANINSQRNRRNKFVTFLENEGGMSAESIQSMKNTTHSKMRPAADRAKISSDEWRHVKSGDNYSKIAKELGVSVEDLEKWNGSKLDTDIFIRVKAAAGEANKPVVTEPPYVTEPPAVTEPPENSETRVNFIFDQKDENDGSEDAEKSQADIRENPEVKAFSARIGGETAATPQTLLLKDHKSWTEDERDMVMNYRFDLPWGNPTRDAMEKTVY